MIERVSGVGINGDYRDYVRYPGPGEAPPFQKHTGGSWGVPGLCLTGTQTGQTEWPHLDRPLLWTKGVVEYLQVGGGYVGHDGGMGVGVIGWAGCEARRGGRRW